MTKIAALSLFVLGTAGFAFGGLLSAPEIDPGQATTAIALLSGSLLIIRGRRKKQ